MADDQEEEEQEERRATADMGEHLRTWRRFIALLKWNLVALGVLLLLLLAFRAHG